MDKKLKEMKKVYIASPYTKGDTGMNVRTQIDAVNVLMNHGFAPFAPLYSHFQHIVYPRHWKDWMAVDVVWVKTCDYLIRLPGESAGADLEVECAIENNIPVFFSMKEFLDAMGLEDIYYTRLEKKQDDYIKYLQEHLDNYETALSSQSWWSGPDKEQVEKGQELKNKIKILKLG